MKTLRIRAFVLENAPQANTIVVQYNNEAKFVELTRSTLNLPNVINSIKDCRNLYAYTSQEQLDEQECVIGELILDVEVEV